MFSLGIYFSISALGVIVIILTDFFSKERIKTLETDTYKYLIITTLIGTCFDVISSILYLNGCDYNNFFYIFICKIVFFYLVVWGMIFSFYIRAISVNNKNKLEKTKKIYYISFFVIGLLIFISPIKYSLVNNIIVPNGLSVIFTYFFAIFFLMSSIYLAIKNRKVIQKKKLRPIYILVVALIFNTIIQAFLPELYLINYLLAMIVIIMYFTIENPDVKMIKELNMARDQADKANRAKTEFLSNMSHEIRTPLNAIVGFSECLMDNENASQTVKDYAKDIVEASQNLLEIVNGILDISKIEANKIEIIEKEYNPREVLESLGKLIMPRIKEKPIEFKMYFSEDLPGILKGDVSKLKQIVLNILTNAAKYTDKGEIIFHTTCVNENNRCLLYISVKDTGRGIKTKNIENLFKKFERIDEDRNTTIEGTGLGLAITKSLTEMMGGKITVYSKYQVDSIFRVYLNQEIIQMEVPKEETTIKKEIARSYPGKKVLIVDDSAINLKVATHLMKDYNFTIDTCLSGIEAIEKVKKTKYDIIFMDIMMPKKNGVETLNELKEDKKFNTPVIALTADAIEGTEEKYLNAGFDSYLSKPIDREMLDKIVQKYLGRD